MFKFSSLLKVIGESRKIERKTREAGQMPTCYGLAFIPYVASFIFPIFNVFKFVYHE